MDENLAVLFAEAAHYRRVRGRGRCKSGVLPIIRFLSFVEINEFTGCWLWMGNCDTAGRGWFKFEGKPIRAYAFSYKTFIGEIPQRMEILHDCDYPRCVNPEHLKVGTHKQNMEQAAGRIRATLIENGHAKIQGKPEVLAAIRRMSLAGHTQKEIAEEFGVSRGLVGRALT